MAANLAGLRRRCRFEGFGDQDGSLSFAQVIAGGLACFGGVTKDTEYVIAELEGFTQGQAVVRERGQQFR